LSAALHAVALASAGDVIVIDAGCLQTAVVGEHLCGSARRKVVAGMIVNGAVRDIGALSSLADFPVFTLGSTAPGPVSIGRGTAGAKLQKITRPLFSGDTPKGMGRQAQPAYAPPRHHAEARAMTRALRDYMAAVRRAT